MNKDMKWMVEHGIYFPINGNIILHSTPGPGVWTIAQSPDPMDKRLGLTKLGEKFEFNFKIYELGHEAITKKVMTIWNSEDFIKTNKNLGIILNGTKGTGKTISAKLMCNELDIPVIVVNNSYDGAILNFISQLNFECIILIDEAEKTFKGDDDEILLKLIDGVYNSARKLYILTTNRLVINENLLGRPGRIRYVQEFRNLPPKAVSDYIDDNLIDKSKKERILQEVDLLEISTIDILKSIVEEVNIFGDIDESNLMNIPKARYIFDVIRFNGCDKNSIPELKKLVKITKTQEQNMYDWFHSTISLKNILDLVKPLRDNEDFNEDIIQVPVPVELAKSGAEKDAVGTTAKIPVGKVVKKAKSSEKEEEPILEDAIKISQLITHVIEECTWVSSYKMTSQFNSLWKDCDTSLGIIADMPDEFGFFTLKDKWDNEESLYLVLRQRSNPSLYRGGLSMIL